MKRITSGKVGIVQGSRVLFSDYADGGQMWTGHGERESRHLVLFKEPFQKAPSVMIGISMWDIDRMHNSRADISTENVTPQGFEIVFKTWGDTRVARVRADWIAIGPVLDEEDWQVD